MVIAIQGRCPSRRLRSSIAAGLLAAAIAAAAQAAPATVEVDARDAPRGIERVHLTLPVKPGRLTLLYPEWLPGEHAPRGPIGGLSGLRFTGNSHAIAWQRDAVNMFAFHLVVPAGVTSLDVQFEVDAVADAGYNNATRTATDALAIVVWNQLVLYPAGVQSDDMQIAASLRLPSGWQLGTALPRAGTAAPEADGAAVTRFATVSLTTLIDSTVIAGRHFRTVDLGGTPATYLHLAADSDAALQVSDETLGHLRKLVREATALFGATHYDDYHFLVTLSDHIGYEGIEHHASSDNRIAERAFVDDDLRHSSGVATLLPHEYVHSWNGKYRRPKGLATGNYDAPMHGDLLWVYEGLTEYLGMVLSARSGLASPEGARDTWAGVAAWMQTRRGREWRPLADTAIAAPISYEQASGWLARTRGVDFYDEGAALWLEADTLIRSSSHGARSLDDFCRLFYGPPSTHPKVVPYDFDAIVNALNAVQPYDWRGFWTKRLNRVRAEAPLEGLTASGWRLGFAKEPTDEQKGAEALSKAVNLRYSLGFRLKDDGAVIEDVMPGSPADQAGVVPDSSLIAINGRKYSKEVLDEALEADPASRKFALLLESDEVYGTVELHYSGGARYPRLERLETPDLLTSILNPKTPE